MIDFNDAFTRQEPPSAEVLAQVRRRLTQQKTALERRKQQILRLSWASICLGLILMGVSLYFKWPVVLAGGGFMAMAGAVVAGIEFVVIMVVAMAAAMVGVVAVAGMAVVGAVAVVGFLGGTVVAHTLFEKHIEKPFNAINAALTDLVELDATDTQDECIQLDEWREQDKTIDAFLTALTRLGRKPVVGEYRAAKEWMENAGKRLTEVEKLERARQACARFDSQGSANLVCQ